MADVPLKRQDELHQGQVEQLRHADHDSSIQIVGSAEACDTGFLTCDDVSCKSNAHPIDVPFRTITSPRVHRHAHISSQEGSADGKEARSTPVLAHSESVLLPSQGRDAVVEGRLPKLTLSTRPRGRSLLDEINKQRNGPTAESRQERSAGRRFPSFRQGSSVGAIATPKSATNKDVSSPVEEIITLQDRFAGSYGSPATYTPMSGSPPSAASSWLGRHVSPRPASIRRRSQRSGTDSAQNSPAASFLRQYGATSTPSAAPLPDAEGQEVGEYVLGKKIGSGGFSVIREAFRSSDPSSRPNLAVKIVRKNIQDFSESENEQAQSFLDHELEIWRSVQHQNILEVHEIQNTEFATFAFMPLAIGGSLFDAVKAVQNVGLRSDLVKVYAAQIAEALRYLHEDVKIIHRDVKLENCLLLEEREEAPEAPGSLRRKPRVVLADFGLSTYAMGTDPVVRGGADIFSGSRNTGQPGSLHYAAPELLHNSKDEKFPLAPGVDVWALGVMLYCMITGKRPFNDSFEPKMIESIKAGEWDRKLLSDRIRCTATDTKIPSSHPEDDSLQKGMYNYDRSFGLRSTVENSSSLGGSSNEIQSSKIAKQDAWARGCSTIIISDGVDPQAVTGVVEGCLTIKAVDRWNIRRVVESDWLASEMSLD